MTATEVLRALHRDGWLDRRQEGSHVILRHPGKTGRVIVPLHKGKILKLATIDSILEDAGLTPDEFRRLL
ncbi:MAG: type II toxin-antitoxin system HicA family toxin [Chloroflexi bacterium]|nr:type II toxin-antitoxin system HicA family toxin [Chloroflexota bacterium]